MDLKDLQNVDNQYANEIARKLFVALIEVYKSGHARLIPIEICGKKISIYCVPNKEDFNR